MEEMKSGDDFANRPCFQNKNNKFSSYIATILLKNSTTGEKKKAIERNVRRPTMGMGTQLRVLSERYLMNTNMTGFTWFSKHVVSLCFG